MNIYKYKLSTGTWMIDDEEIILYSSSSYTNKEMDEMFRDAVISISNSRERKSCSLDDVKDYLCKEHDFFGIELSTENYLRELSEDWVEEVKLAEELKKKKTEYIYLTAEELSDKYEIKINELSENMPISADDKITYNNIQCFPIIGDNLRRDLLEKLLKDYHIKGAYISANTFDSEGNLLQINISTPSQSCKGIITGVLLEVYADE